MYSASPNTIICALVLVKKHSITTILTLILIKRGDAIFKAIFNICLCECFIAEVIINKVKRKTRLRMATETAILLHGN